jgi:hypothetical protein
VRNCFCLQSKFKICSYIKQYAREFIADAQTMHSNGMRLHKEIVEGLRPKRNGVVNESTKCAASDQVAESYDLARATLATKLATMSTGTCSVFLI